MQNKYACAKLKRLPVEFISDIEDIIADSFVIRLKFFRHHHRTNRLCHSLNVAYFSWKICKVLGLDKKSAARGAMLHDLYHYNRKEYIREYGEAFHNSRHPRLAYINASQRFALNRIEADCILCHMFPSTLRIPRYKESLIVSLADKLSALLEFAGIVH